MILIEALKMPENAEKQKFRVFCLFTPLYRRFRLSRVWHAQECEEIYRLVSKNLNFMPCGLVFDRFCVEVLKMAENLMKIYENLMKIQEMCLDMPLGPWKICLPRHAPKPLHSEGSCRGGVGHSEEGHGHVGSKLPQG